MAVVANTKSGAGKASSTSVDSSVLEEKLGYQLRIADRVLSKDFLQRVGMTPVQFSVFSLVATNKDLSQVAVGEALNMDRASTMAIVQKLEVAGLLERRTSSHDKRTHALQLTTKGKKGFVAMNKRVTAYDDEFKNRLNATELKTLFKCLKKLRG